MFDLGMQELIVIFIVALLVFGPKRLPELGKTIGKGLAELRRAMQDVRIQMDAELEERHKPLETGPEESYKPVESEIAGNLPEGLADKGELEEKGSEKGAGVGQHKRNENERKEDARE